MQSQELRAWIEVDIAALMQNAVTVRKQAGVPLIPMVKADAYGLGAEHVAGALQRLNPWAFGVATLDEGIALRESGVSGRILVFIPPLANELPELRRHSLTPVLGQQETIAEWCSVPGHAWHLSIETGMNRAGAHWTRSDELAGLLRALPPEGVMTHFHSSEADDGSMQLQMQRFTKALDALPTNPALLHAENSAAIARQRSPYNLVRPGIFLYGVGSGSSAAIQPLPVLSLHARVVELHEIPAGDTVSYNATYTASGVRRIATVALGYADGYRRVFSNVGRAAINGTLVPVAGIVTMDMTMLDVTGIDCSLGDEAVFLGKGGSSGPTVEDAAKGAGMSPYELLTGMRARLPRIYRADPH